MHHQIVKRLLYDEMLKWKTSEDRKPLIITGVRQCGKTYLMKKFAAENYDDMIYLEFEGDSALSKIFETDLDPKRIISAISVKYMKDITKDTLLIFDEIQTCPRALTSLKYFCENAPEYHIICAGSLLGLQISGGTSFPVGKVSFLDLRPMSFREFLLAANPRMHDHVNGLKKEDRIDAGLMEILQREYRTYCCVGGMPEAVSVWIRTRNMIDTERIQRDILNSYRLDFLKHVPENDIKKVNMIWDHLPIQLSKENRRFFFGHAVSGSRSKDLEDAIQWLVDAGMIYKVSKISRPSIPLSSYASSNIFKLYMADVGLLRIRAGVSADNIMNGDMEDDFKGGLTENFVLCELVSAGHRSQYYWGSDNIAEVDFVCSIGGRIVPIEIKSGKRTRAASLAQYIDKYGPLNAILISGENFGEGDIVSRVPLYAVWKVDEWIEP